MFKTRELHKIYICVKKFMFTKKIVANQNNNKTPRMEPIRWLPETSHCPPHTISYVSRA